MVFRFWCLAFALARIPSVQAATEARSLKWSELAAAVANRNVTLVLRTNARVFGVVTAVQPDSLRMDVLKSSAKALYPPGQASIPRNAVVQIRLKRVKGPARAIGAAGAGTAAGLGTVGWAISEERTNVSDTKRIGQWAAITAVAVAGGYFIGRMIDTAETIIDVAPEK